MMIDAPFMAVSRDAGTRHGSPLKAVPLSSFTLSETTGLPREATGVEALFAGVPPVYRCVTLRARRATSIGGLPGPTSTVGSGRNTCTSSSTLYVSGFAAPMSRWNPASPVA